MNAIPMTAPITPFKYFYNESVCMEVPASEDLYVLATVPLAFTVEATYTWVAALYTSDPVPPRAISDTWKRIRMGQMLRNLQIKT
jgi:hypothetical protein